MEQINLKNIQNKLGHHGMDFDEFGKDYVIYVTRENGDVNEETASPIDIKTARKLVGIAKSHYPNVHTEVNVFDEWVSVTIRFNDAEIIYNY